MSSWVERVRDRPLIRVPPHARAQVSVRFGLAMRQATLPPTPKQSAADAADAADADVALPSPPLPSPPSLLPVRRPCVVALAAASLP